MDGIKISEMLSALEEIAKLLSESEPKQTTEKSKVALSIYKAFKDRSAKYYLSYLLSKATCFLEDAPYCFVSSILENPKERKVSVSKPEGIKSQQTVSQIMRDLLPGTWNFRLGFSRNWSLIKITNWRGWN